MDFAETERQHLRLTILRALERDGNHTINESLLMPLVEAYGFKPSRDALRAQLRWLEDVDCVTVEDLDGFLVAALTERGLEVAEARVQVDGIARPRLRR